MSKPPNIITPPQVQGNNALKVSAAPLISKRGKRVGLYGTGGIGKTSLVVLLARLFGDKAAYYDLDESLDALDVSIPTRQVFTWAELRNDIQQLKNPRVIAIDSFTRAEELAVANTLEKVPNEKGQFVKSIEGYGYGKGYQHVFDTFLPLLSDLDMHARQGCHIVLLMHECMSSVPNPQGDDYIRYEPRLQNPNSGKASIRLRLKEWLDQLVFIGFDVNVKDNKASGSGTRTIYPVEMPHCMAKTRSLKESFEYVDGSDDLWQQLKMVGN